MARSEFASYPGASRPSPNVSTAERWISVLAGGALVANAVRSRSAGSLLGALAGAALLHRGTTGTCAVYQHLGISTADEDGRATIPYGRGVRVERGVTVLRPAAELFSFWRDFRNLSRFMDHVERVDILDERRSHWLVKGPAGHDVEWDAEIINEVPGELIAWKTINHPEVEHAGSVHFKELPNSRGTEILVVLRYDPPGGKIGSAIARLFGEEPSMQVASDLRRLKRIMEIGEEPTVEGQPSARDEEGAE